MDVYLLAAEIGRGKSFGEITPGFLIFWLLAVAAVAVSWFQIAKRNKKK